MLALAAAGAPRISSVLSTVHRPMSKSIRILPVSRQAMLHRLPDILDIYALVHGLNAQAIAERKAIMQRHFQRRGYRGFIATDGERLVGFTYGYTGDPGQYWYDRVWAAMTPAQRKEWMEPEHFEFVELAVHPEYQQQGIGGTLHDLLLEERPEPVALLTVRADNRPALSLYQKRGWIVVLDDFRFAPNTARYFVMGKRLSSPDVRQNERGDQWHINS